MKTFEGTIIQKKKSKKKLEIPDEYVSCFCTLCLNYIDMDVSRKLSCINSECRFVSHVECLGDLLVDNGHYVPIEGDCPACKKKYLWSDWIGKSLIHVKDKEAKEEEEKEEDLNFSQKSDENGITVLSDDSEEDFLTQVI